MKRDIYFIIDSSGSFNECGKNYLQYYLVDAIANAIASETIASSEEFTFLLWSDQITDYNLFDKIIFQGQSDFTVLADYLMNLEKESLVFFLTDGNFNGDIIILSEELKQKNVILVPFAVGADSDIGNLEMLSGSSKVYKPENLISSINSIILECEL